MELARQRHRRAIASVANAPAALLVLAGVCMALSSLVGVACAFVWGSELSDVLVAVLVKQGRRICAHASSGARVEISEIGPRGRSWWISEEGGRRLWGSSIVGPEVDQPEIRANMGAQGSDLDNISFVRHRNWPWS